MLRSYLYTIVSVLYVVCFLVFYYFIYQPTNQDSPKAPVVSLSKQLYFNCLVLVGSRNGFERDLHMQKKLV